MAQPVKLLTAKEAAKMLGISVRTLRSMCRTGIGPPRKRGSGKRYFFTQSLLEQWVSNSDGGPA